MDETREETNELNIFIHEVVMGKCWHEWEVVDTPQPCKKCHETQSWSERFIEAHPDYCSSLDLIHEAELKVIVVVGWRNYEIWLAATVLESDAPMEDAFLTKYKELGDSGTENEWHLKDDELISIATADALTRAKAVRRAMEGNEKL